MQAIILKCPKQGRFHFGKTGLDENSSLYQTSDIIHSDTLFSALINLCAKAFPKEILPLIDAFRNHIRISSAYYCLQVEQNGTPVKNIYFLPKPDYLELQNRDVAARKKVRKITYVSKTVWEKGLLPEEWKAPQCSIIDKRFVLHANDLPIELSDQIETISTQITAPKIADHLRKRVNNIYFQTDLLLGHTTFSRSQLRAFDLENLSIHPSFYFLIKESLPESEKRVYKLLEVLIDLLADEGIGGSISTGCGRLLACEREAFEFKMPQNEDHAVSMSLISPATSDRLEEIYRGNVVVRGGRDTAQFGRLKRVKMIKEGAVISKSVEGDIVPIHANGKFLRYGKAFPIPMHPNYVIHEAL